VIALQINDHPAHAGARLDRQSTRVIQHTRCHASGPEQVLVSIQSLIMVPQPYFNEPGYESSMHTERGRKEDRDYSANIREQTMHYAIQEQLRSPPRHFEDAVRTHFRCGHGSARASGCVTCHSPWLTVMPEAAALVPELFSDALQSLGILALVVCSLFFTCLARHYQLQPKDVCYLPRRLQKQTVIATCETWIAETTAHGDKARAGRMKSHLSRIRELLNAL